MAQAEAAFADMDAKRNLIIQGKLFLLY